MLEILLKETGDIKILWKCNSLCFNKKRKSDYVISTEQYTVKDFIIAVTNELVFMEKGSGLMKKV